MVAIAVRIREIELLRRMILTAQEIEFAFACKTFVLEMDPRVGNQIIIEGDALAIPDSEKRGAPFSTMVSRACCVSSTKPSNSGLFRWIKFRGFSPTSRCSTRRL